MVSLAGFTLHWIAWVFVAFGLLIVLGTLILNMASESAWDHMPEVPVPARIVGTIVAHAQIGIFGSVVLSLFLGPFTFLYVCLQWGHLPSLLVGMPLGFGLVFCAFYIFDWITNRLRKNKPAAPFDGGTQ